MLQDNEGINDVLLGMLGRHGSTSCVNFGLDGRQTKRAELSRPCKLSLCNPCRTHWQVTQRPAALLH